MKKFFYISLMALLLLCDFAAAAKKEIVYVRRAENNNNDSIVIAAIAGYGDSSVYNVKQLLKNRITQSDLAMLKAADVVIMGRNLPSADQGSAMGVWDSITKPVISMNAYALRNNRAKWFNDGTVIAAGSATNVMKAKLFSSADTNIFKGLSDSIVWWNGNYCTMSIKSAGNGLVLARTKDSIPLFVRWAAGTEFYPGAGHFPLAERTFIGCGSDAAAPINYYGFSNEAKKVFFKELGRMAGVPVKVVFVRRAENNYNDSVVVAAIAGYGDSSMFQVKELLKNRIMQSDLAMLNAADVVIMGRNLPSADQGSAMGVWDSITKPVISMNAYALRNNRAKWFNDGTVIAAGSATNVMKAKLFSSADTNIFKGLSDSIVWWNGNYCTMSIKSAGNGLVLARTKDSIPLFVRWAAGAEFYAGAGHFPMAERTFIGCGSDAAAPINYFGFSKEAKEIFFKELLRMGSSKPKALPKMKISTLSTLTASVGTISPALGSDLKYMVTVPFGTTAVPTVSATPTHAVAKMVIVNAATLKDSVKITVTAEDTTAVSVYVVKFSVTPANTDATLSGLEISEGKLTPDFSADVTAYTVTLPAGTTAIPTIKVADAKSALSTVVKVDATSFDTDATITVTAQDVTVKKVYKINFEVEAGVGVNNNTLSNVSIFPSPATDFLKITNAGNAVVSIYSVNGKLINQIKLSDNNASINVSNLVGGTYLLNIKSGNNNLNSKFVKR